MKSFRKRHLVPCLLVIACSILIPDRLQACILQDPLASTFRSNVNEDLNDYARILEDADSNDRTCVEQAGSVLTQKVNATPATTWGEWLQGANAALAYAAANRIGANGFATKELDQALDTIKNNLRVGREPNGSGGIACAKVSLDQCVDDFAVAAPGFAWLAAYEYRRGRAATTYQQQAIGAINDAFNEVCIQATYSKPQDTSYCNGTPAELDAGQARTLSFNHGQQLPPYGFGLMTSLASAAIGLQESAAMYQFSADQKSIARGLAREMQSLVVNNTFTFDCPTSLLPDENGNLGFAYCGGIGPEPYQANMYELKEFYDNWFGGMPAGGYQSDLASFSAANFHLQPAGNGFFSYGRYEYYFRQSHDWVVSTPEMMPFDNYDPIGNVDSISAGGVVSGWTCDQDAPAHGNRVDIYSNGTLAGFGYATLDSESAVNTQCGGGTAHRFQVQLQPWARGTTVVPYGLDYTWYGFTQLSCANCFWPDNPPAASFGFTTSGRTVSVDGSASTDDAGISGYQWNWGDGQTGSGLTGNHTFAANGTYVVTLTVTDTGSHTNSTTRNVTVTDNPPVAAFTISCTNNSCTANGAASSDDLGISQFQWSWGDGQSLNGGTPASHTYSAAGTYTVTLTVVDTAGQTNATSHSVTICVAPAITTQPAANPTPIAAGSTSTLTIVVTGTAPVTVSWYTATGTFLGTGTSINVSPTVSTAYYAVVSNSCGSVQSVNVSVSICSPTLGSAPTATPSTITSGQISKLESAGATGSGTLTYLWYKSDGTFVTSTTAKKINVTPTVTTSYYYKVSNSCGTTGPSPNVTVTVQ